jgi:hypothetical protein
MNAAKSLAILIFLSTSVFGQDRIIPIHVIDPDPDTGRPLLVSTPCAGAERWEIPILVYEDSDMEVFVDQPCLIAAVQMGFDQDGKYSVQLYSHYKGNFFCKQMLRAYETSPTGKRDLAAKGLNEKDLRRECELVHYKARMMSVDTRGKLVQFTRIFLLDEDGTNAGSLKSDALWHPISEVDIGTTGHAMETVITRATAMVEKAERKYREHLRNGAP